MNLKSRTDAAQVTLRGTETACLINVDDHIQGEGLHYDTLLAANYFSKCEEAVPD